MAFFCTYFERRMYLMTNYIIAFVSGLVWGYFTAIVISFFRQEEVDENI